MAPILYLSPTLLQTGDNVIAVELHQARLNHSDVTRGLELTATPVPSPPRMPITYNPGAGTVTITWNPSGRTLQASNDLMSWTDLAGVSGVTIAASEAYKFYRVSQ